MKYTARSRRASIRRAMRPAVAAVLLLTVIAAHTAFAHHSAAMYDQKKPITVEGTVIRYLWANPHVYIYVAQQQGDQRVEWEVEGGPPSIMRRLGWGSGTLKVGERITVLGWPAKSLTRRALRPTAIRYNGSVLFDQKTEAAQLSHADGVASRPAEGLEGVWLTVYDEALDDRLDADKLSLTAAGRAAYKRFDERKMHPAARCVPYTAPFFMITPDLKRITRSGNLVLIDGEFDAAQRTVHLDQATHDDAPPSNQGHSIGHWEGSSLVIDTTRFSANPVGNAYGLPSGSRKHLIERLTPAADGRSLTYHFELSDPEFMAAPVSGDVRWLFRPETAYAPERCNPDIARRYTESE